MSAEERRPDTAFWVEPAAVQSDRLTLDPTETHHLLRVHRALPGAPFEAVDGTGHLYRCVLESADGGRAAGRILERVEGAGELARPVHLLVGLSSAGSVEAVVEHAVPLGAASIDFVAAERSGRPPLGPERLARLLRLARAGLKQSRRSRLPSLRSSASVEAALSALAPGRGYVADPGGVPWTDPPQTGIQKPVVISVGPPGAFTDRELATLLERGFSRIYLGPSRLTTETAAIALLSIVRK
jgi:16S rRNA (uracil1498-N3)-methyltransferase